MFGLRARENAVSPARPSVSASSGLVSPASHRNRIASAGHQTTGLDIEEPRSQQSTAAMPRAASTADAIAPLIEDGSLTARRTRPASASRGRAHHVPTPIDSEGRPYEVPVERACETFSSTSRTGLDRDAMHGRPRGPLVACWSTRSRAGRKVGRGHLRCFSPERNQPGRPVFNVSNYASSWRRHRCLPRARVASSWPRSCPPPCQ